MVQTGSGLGTSAKTVEGEAIKYLMVLILMGQVHLRKLDRVLMFGKRMVK